MTRSKKLTEPRILDVNYYGFDHEAVFKRFACDRYVGTFCIFGGYLPWAFYRAPKPDRSKGHKKYVMLQVTTSPDGRRGMMVSGISAQKLSHYRYQEALHCLGCNTVAVSSMRHHCAPCECKKVSVDGGKDYTKITYDQDAPPTKLVVVDWLTGKLEYRKLEDGKVKK